MAISTVLAAVSGESCDTEVVRLACRLLRPNRGTLHILYVIEVDRRMPVDAEIVATTAKAESVLRCMEKIAKAEKRKTEGEFVQARDAGSAVVNEAFGRSADAIVLGVPYQRRYGVFTLGSAAPYVLKNAPCQVVLWRDYGDQSTRGRALGRVRDE
jgi:nucleotide-binding universal stress UspA family protein